MKFNNVVNNSEISTSGIAGTRPMSPEGRWSLWIDVEGFSEIYRRNETDALLALGWLLESIFKIGTTIYSDGPGRLFAHQFGDGLVVVSNFPEDSAERPIAIAISVMRHLIARGVACKSAVACGGFSDVGGCFSESIFENSQDRHIVSMGAGLMTIIPVMGTALITSHKLSSQRRGAVLLIRDECFKTIPKEAVISLKAPTAVDWIHSELALARRISSKAGLIYDESSDAAVCLRKYIDVQGSSAGDEWVTSTIEANRLNVL